MNILRYRNNQLWFLTFILTLGLVFANRAYGQIQEVGPLHSSRIGISAGMGVNIHNANDIVDRINGSGITTQRVDEFKSGVEFFGAVAIPFAADWLIKAEYVYMLASYSLNSGIGAAVSEFTYALHMPSVGIQYILFEASTYNVKAGAGVGYHFGTYEEKFFASRYSSQGFGSLLELEGNTALGEDLFAHLGIQTRWDFVGDLKDANGKSPFPNSVQTSMHFFSLGARLGMSYYF